MSLNPCNRKLLEANGALLLKPRYDAGRVPASVL
jgi:hypothetical protein